MQYDKSFKEEALKLSDEIGVKAAAAQLGIPYYTLSGWRNNRKKYGADLYCGSDIDFVVYGCKDILKLERELESIETFRKIDIFDYGSIHNEFLLEDIKNMKKGFINRHSTFCKCLKNLEKSRTADLKEDFVLEGTVLNFCLTFDIS